MVKLDLKNARDAHLNKRHEVRIPIKVLSAIEWDQKIKQRKRIRLVAIPIPDFEAVILVPRDRLKDVVGIRHELISFY